MADENPLSACSDEWLVAMAMQSGARATDHTAYMLEMMRRLKSAIEVQERSSTRLGKRIWWLNVWLLVFTVAIFGLTVVQILVSMKGVR